MKSINHPPISLVSRRGVTVDVNTERLKLYRDNASFRNFANEFNIRLIKQENCNYL